MASSNKNKLVTKITDFPLFKKVMLYAEKMFDETTLRFQEHDIVIDDMDPTRIMMETIRIKDIIEQPVTTNIGVNLTDLKYILETMNGLTKVDFELGTATIKNLKFKDHGEHFSYNCLDIFTEPVPKDSLKKIEYKYTKVFNADSLSNILKKASVHSDVINISCNEKGLKFKATSQQGAYSNNSGITKESKDVEKVTISVPFMKQIISPLMMEEPVSIQFEKDNPAHIMYSSSVLDIDAWLAPRVDEADPEPEEDEEDDKL